jgi:alkylation response protein AidB-like acyl-CoA dehydrogenase
MGLIDIDVGLTTEDLAVRDTCHKFAEEVLRPAGKALDRMPDPAQVIAPASILWDVFRQYRKLGIGKVYTDTTMEPVAKARMMYVASEELTWGDAGLAISLSLLQFHFPWIEASGNAELRERFCSPDRPTIGCWAITEPDHGSDSLAFTEPSFSNPKVRANCIARKDGNDFIVNGQKAAWVSNGSIADIAVVFCTLDPAQGFKGGAVILVPLDLPGVYRPKPLDKIGQRALNQGEIYFHDVRVPATYMAVAPEVYPMVLETMLCLGNAGMSQMFVGVARAALEAALDYAKERVQGGRAIFEHQNVKARLFKMFIKVEAARALARRTALYLAVNPPSIQYAIAAKVLSTNTAFEVASEAVQIFGGNGLSREYPIEKIMRDARAAMIEDGCNDLLGLVAGARL